MFTSLFLPFKHYKFLLSQLTQREIKARYKQSIIGRAWVVFNPLAQLAVYTFVFSFVFKSPSANIPYPIFLIAGLLPWSLFQGSIAIATMSLVENASLLRKVSFPREIIPYSVVLAKVLDFAVASIIFIIFALVYQLALPATIFLVFPILGIQLIFTSGIALMFSTFNLFYRDVQYLANLMLMLWMYMTPIVYPLSMVPSTYRILYSLNPMVGIIGSYRYALFGAPIEGWIVLWTVFISFLTFAGGFYIFKRAEKVFADIA